MMLGRMITGLFEFLPRESSSGTELLRPKWLVLGDSSLGGGGLDDAGDWDCSLGLSVSKGIILQCYENMNG